MARVCPLCDMVERAATDAEGAVWSAISVGLGLGLAGIEASAIRDACCQAHASGAQAALARGVEHTNRLLGGRSS